MADRMINKILILILIITAGIYSQQPRTGFGLKITGTVHDSSTDAPIEYANIVLFTPADSSMVTGTISDQQGKFELTGLRPGKYYMTVNFIGYDKKFIDNIILGPQNRTVDLGIVYIHPSAVLLEDVVVEGERSPITYEIDKKVLNVDELQTVVSGTAADVLENVPSVTVDIEGNVSLRGSTNFTVLIDGRPTILDPQDALQQIPASSIETIEIITNPSAKYDPEGTAGIININMKENENAGISGIANLNAGLNDKYGGDFLFEFRNSSFNTNFGIDYNRRFFPGDRRQETNTTFDDITSFINSSGSSTWGRISFGLRGGIDLFLSKSDVLAIGARYGQREHNMNFNLNYDTWTSDDPLHYFYLSRTERERSGDFYSLYTNYQHKFNNSGHQLIADFNYRYSTGDENTLNQTVESGVVTAGRKTFENGPEDEFEIKIDYTLPIDENHKFEAGYNGEADISTEKVGLADLDPETGTYVFFPEFAHNTNSNENQHALYTIYAGEWGNFGLQTGFRTEYTYRKVEVTDLNKEYKIDRTDYFPSIHSSYKFSGGNQVMASYTRRIDRPRGWYLEPFETWIDQNNVRIGNPGLLPEFIDSYEGGFQTFFMGISLSAEAYYRVTHNKIERIRSAYSEGVTLNSIENVGKDYSLGTEFMFNFNVIQPWNVILMGNVYNYKVEGVLFDVPFSQESFNWSVRMNNMFKLTTTTQLQINANYYSPTASSQGTREGFFSTDLSVRQDLFQKSLSVTLQIRDLLGTAKFESTDLGNNYYSYNYFTRESPMVMLNLKYNINNYEQERNGQRPEGMNGEGEDF
ncbi:MAG: outer membrane beta-barrel family protein [Ignavibacteriaceae bacterium]